MTKEELKNRVENLRSKVNDLAKQLNEAITGLIGTIAVRVLPSFDITPFDMSKKWVKKDEHTNTWSDEYRAWKETAPKKFAAIPDSLHRLALAERCEVTSRGDCGHFCCPDDRPKEYLDRMDVLGLRGLVTRGQSEWHIVEEKFVEARLKLIEDHGTPEEKKTIAAIEDEKKTAQAELKQAETDQTNQHYEEVYEKTLAGQIVSDQAKAFIQDRLRNSGMESLTVANPDAFCWLSSRSEWGSSGGVGYFDKVHAYYFGQTKMVEFQWRDRYSHSADKPWLKVNNLEAAAVSFEGKTATVSVMLVNNDSKRPHKFTFEHKEIPAVIEISKNEQETFAGAVDKTIEGVMARKFELWHLKPQMVAKYPAGMVMPMGTPTYVNYRQPSVKQKVVRANIGVAAFVIEEQIDHCVDDPQTRYELYVMTHKESLPRLITEDHGYERNEGSRVIAIVELNQDSILINTQSGQRTLKI